MYDILNSFKKIYFDYEFFLKLKLNSRKNIKSKYDRDFFLEIIN